MFAWRLGRLTANAKIHLRANHQEQGQNDKTPFRNRGNLIGRPEDADIVLTVTVGVTQTFGAFAAEETTCDVAAGFRHITQTGFIGDAASTA